MKVISILCRNPQSSRKISAKLRYYGISISNKFQKAEVTDISDDFNFVRSLFDSMVEGELCPEHLENVVEDFLSDGCSKIISFPKKSDDPLPVA